MRIIAGVFLVAGVMSVFTLITLWAVDWIDNYDESGRYE